MALLKSAGVVAGQVEMAIEEVLEIAKSTVSQIEDTAQNDAATPFRNMEVERGAFSQVPAAQALAGQHEAVKQVFLETIEGVVSDLAEFKQRLLTSAQSMQASDQSAEQMLMALGASYEDYQFASDARYEQSRGEHAAELGVPGVEGEGPTGEAAPASGGTESVATPGQEAQEGNESM